MQAKSPGLHLRSRFQRQLVLATIAALVTLAFFLLLPSPDTIWRLSMGTAYAGLLFLAAALIIGPLNVLRSAPNPVSTYLRRDIGIVAGVLALAHTIIGLLVHFRGDPIQYFFYRTAAGIVGLRSDIFGVANYVGLGRKPARAYPSRHLKQYVPPNGGSCKMEKHTKMELCGRDPRRRARPALSGN